MSPKSRGFLLTLSVILFASTLVVFSQAYLQTVYSNEKAVLGTSSLSNIASMGDSIAAGMIKIIGVEVDLNSSDDLNVSLTETIPRGYSTGDEITAYEAFLEGSFFGRMAGTQSLDTSGVTDGVAEVFIGNLLAYESDYVNDISDLSPIGGNTLLSIDLNIASDEEMDLNEFSVSSGSAQLNIMYYDSGDSFTRSFTIDPDSVSRMRLGYPDNNVDFIFGLTEKGTDSVRVDSNSTASVTYSLRVNYSDGADYVPVRINSELRQTLGNADSNSMLKARN